LTFINKSPFGSIWLALDLIYTQSLKLPHLPEGVFFSVLEAEVLKFSVNMVKPDVDCNNRNTTDEKHLQGG